MLSLRAIIGGFGVPRPSSRAPTSPNSSPDDESCRRGGAVDVDFSHLQEPEEDSGLCL
jgi:hypothetical protein